MVVRISEPLRDGCREEFADLWVMHSVTHLPKDFSRRFNFRQDDMRYKLKTVLIVSDVREARGPDRYWL